MDLSGHWLPVGSEGKQGGSSNDQRSPGECEAVSRRAAALLLNFMVPEGEEQEFRRSRHRALQHRGCYMCYEVASLVM